MTYPRGGSEYGGFPGLVQPEPHEVKTSATEQLMLAQLTEAGDPESSIESVTDDIRRQGRIDGSKQNGS
jgi:hypothetical protein